MINENWHLNISARDYANPVLIGKYESTVQMAQDILDRGLTVRQAAREYCISKSTVSQRIENYLKYLDIDLYHEVKYVLKKRKEYPNTWKRRL